MISAALPSQTQKLLQIAENTGIFKEGEVDELLGTTLSDFFEGNLPASHQVQVLCNSLTAEPEGWAYFAPSENNHQAWDLWWIGIKPDLHSTGLGSRLLKFVEEWVTKNGGQVLIIETSSTDQFSDTRNFYRNRGYEVISTIPNFYGSGEGKLTFSKTLKS